MSGGATARTSAYWSAPDRGQIAPGSLPEATMVPRSSRTVKAPPSSLQPLEHFMPTWNLKASPAVIADGRSHALRWTSWALTVQRAPVIHVDSVCPLSVTLRTSVLEAKSLRITRYVKPTND